MPVGVAFRVTQRSDRFIAIQALDKLFHYRHRFNLRREGATVFDDESGLPNHGQHAHAELRNAINRRLTIEEIKGLAGEAGERKGVLEQLDRDLS